MSRAYRFINHQCDGDVFCVQFQKESIDDHELEELGAELGRLIDEENCRKMLLDFGSTEPELLYSLFLAKLIALTRRLDGIGGGLALAHVSDDARMLFRVAGIEKFFRFYPDRNSAVQGLNAPAQPRA